MPVRFSGMSTELLSESVAGAVVRPGDPGWDDSRLFHTGIGEPDAVVHAASVADVQAAVRYAAAHDLPLSVRGGGHSAWGTVPGGVLVDLAAISDIEVDGTRVHVGGGAVWGAVAEALAPHGIALSSGDTASVGVGGLALGGGIGWMVRSWGLACDQLVGAQLVTATGEVIEVDDETHPDLMWALRGGGGNFGVATRLDFEAHRLPALVHVELTVSVAPRDLLPVLRETLADAPRELTVTYMDVPPMDPNAAPGARLVACWIGGDPDDARRALAPVLALDGVTEVSCGVKQYRDVLAEMPGYDPERPVPGFIGGNTLAPVLDEDLIDALAGFREKFPASVVFLRSLGGAYGDVAQGDTPFPARDATWFVMAGAFDIPGTDREGAASAWEALEARGAGVYGNFTVSTSADVVAKMFDRKTAARLAEVKRAWDPDNLFRRNHNIVPD